jgi:hypothetical protein
VILIYVAEAGGLAGGHAPMLKGLH